MPIAASMLPELDHELASTRRTLERVPFDQAGWRPHAKSYTMAELATHVAMVPSWAAVSIAQDAFDVGAPEAGPRPKAAATREELLALFDRHAATARAALLGASDETLLLPWSLLDKGRTVLTLPRVAVLRSFVMNHLVHHRGQLTVYLRMNDVPVPALYGPSADEAGM
jgi:uncharacterized damage-inducible protein DinB